MGISQLVTIVFLAEKQVPSNSFYAGLPARPHKEWLKQEANLRKIGDLLKKVKVLEETVAKLEK